MILYEQNLGHELRKAFDNANHRIWIAVPFIGVWDLVERITGSNWIIKRDIDVRLLTDIRNDHYICQDTYQIFKQRAQIKTLDGLHAKIYLIDDLVFLTSANLTGAAFSKRFEIGIKLNIDEYKDTVKVFEKWWKTSKDIDDSWIPTRKNKNSNNEYDDGNIDGLKQLWDLPNKSVNKKDFNEYLNCIMFYGDFANIYKSYGDRLMKELPIYQEIDSFFNYLFHEHPKKPSNEFTISGYRHLTAKEKIIEFKKYFKQYKKWLDKNVSFDSYRRQNIDFIQNKLSKANIDKLKNKDVENVIKCLHCMNSLPLNRVRFLNPNNNKLDVIIKEWKELLHNDEIQLENRMQRCKNNLYSFGKSSIRELLALYYPDKYPVINRNSNSGMKFFGYNLKTY
jgi:hypothetical protein